MRDQGLAVAAEIAGQFVGRGAVQQRHGLVEPGHRGLVVVMAAWRGWRRGGSRAAPAGAWRRGRGSPGWPGPDTWRPPRRASARRRCRSASGRSGRRRRAPCPVPTGVGPCGRVRRRRRSVPRPSRERPWRRARDRFRRGGRRRRPSERAWTRKSSSRLPPSLSTTSSAAAAARSSQRATALGFSFHWPQAMSWAAPRWASINTSLAATRIAGCGLLRSGSASWIAWVCNSSACLKSGLGPEASRSPNRQIARALTCGRFSLDWTAFWASSAASGKRPAWARIWA